MRLFFTALVWLLIVGGLFLYIEQRDARILQPAEATTAPEILGSDYVLEITPTFGAEADPFALRDEDQAPATLLVRLGGVDVLREARPLARGETLRIEPLTGLQAGRNELFIEASPSFEESHLAHALRVKLLLSGVVQLDRTLWGEAGTKVTGTVEFLIEHPAGASHDH